MVVNARCALNGETDNEMDQFSPLFAAKSFQVCFFASI